MRSLSVMSAILLGSTLGSASAHDRDRNTPLCNLFIRMLNWMGLETDAFASSTGE